MGLANPWLLLGLAALAVPVLVHLVRREERSGRVFPSLMFVRRIRFEVKRRRRLRDRALLALRCLALAALVLAFAGPYLHDRPAPGSGGQPPRDLVLLLDRSYSMDHPQRWERAVAEVEARIDGLTPDERAALVAFDDTARIVAGLTADKAVLRSALGGIEPGRRGTGFAAALGTADAILAREGTGRPSVVLVSDLQRSALDAGAPPALDAGVELEIVPVSGPVGANAAVIDARLASRGGVESTLAVRIRNTGDAPLREPAVDLEVDGRHVDSRPLGLAPGAERTLSFPIVLAGDRPTRVTVTTGADALAADDRYHAVLAPRRPLQAALVEPDSPRAQHTIFLEEALRLATDPAFEVRRIPAGALGASLLAEVDALFINGTPLPSAAAARAVADFVAGGGGVFVAAGPDTGGPAAALLPGAGFGAVETPDGTGAGAAAASRDHPVWSAAGLDSDKALAGARVTGLRRLRPAAGDRVLARLGDGTPLLVEHSHGAGRVLALATTADPRWGSLALAPGFVPLVQAAGVRLAGARPWRSAYTAGEVIDLRRHAGGLPDAGDWRAYLDNGGAVMVEDPSGKASRLEAPGGTLFTGQLPGIHELHQADARGASLPFAVNADRAESMLAAAAPAELKSRIARRQAAEAAAPGVRAPQDTGSGALPVWLLALAGLALMIEGALANRLARRRTEAAT